LAITATSENEPEEETPPTAPKKPTEKTSEKDKYSGKWTVIRMIAQEENGDSEEYYFFELRASNGEKLLTSEDYTTYQGALSGIKTYKNNIAKGNFKIATTKKGDFIFKILNGKNTLLCLGENYSTRARCESALASTVRFAQKAILEENVLEQTVKIPADDGEAITPVDEGHTGKWIIYASPTIDGQQTFYFELYANNGERLLTSEEYTKYEGAINGIETHKTNIKKGNFRIALTKHGDYIFKLMSGNGQLLCLGEHYKTKRLCQNAIESVKRFALNAPILTDPEIAHEQI
ncbi:MAG: YegP family protein, partial [Clostridia bacterium]|nr:YegP family protein [Clostridia bacterium]